MRICERVDQFGELTSPSSAIGSFRVVPTLRKLEVVMIRQGRKDISNDQLDRLIACFSVVKAEHDDGLDLDNVFVCTGAFVRLIAQQERRANTILLGRKGDGKTALLRRLAHDVLKNGIEENDRRTRECFRHLDMEAAFFSELIGKFRELTTKITEKFPNIPPDQVAKKLWTKFIILSSLQILSTEIQLNHADALSPDQKEKIFAICMLVEEEIGATSRPGTSDVSQNFLSYLALLVRRLRIDDESIAKDYSEPMKRSVDPLEILRDLDERFSEAATYLKSLRYHLTITLDRFDDYIDRLISNDPDITRLLRRNFLHGLVSALYALEMMMEYDWLRVVASLPDDLVIDLALREFASHKKLLFLEIKWDTEDLWSILDHRVGSIVPGATWSDLFPFLISSANKLVEKKESCRDYLIRHTTRRPRELMCHASAIFEHIKATNQPVGSRQINKIIQESNPNIVDDQIIPEWKTVVPALKSFIDRIAREEPDTVFTFSQLTQWGNAEALINATNRKTAQTESSKTFIALAILYRTGIVGFRVRRQGQRNGYIHQGEGDYVRYIFSHSQRFDPISDITSLLIDPQLGILLESDRCKAVKGLLTEGKHAKYEVKLCFGPLFFESLNATHSCKFIIDEVDPLAEIARDA